MALTRPRAEQIYNLDYKQATRVVTIVNITLTGGAPNNVDGVNLTLGDRVLVTGQATASQNGIYDVYTLGTGSNGTWVRTSDANSTGEIEAGMIIMVTEGVIYADTQWKLITDNPIDIGVTGLIFTQNYLANSISSGSSNVVVSANANVTISSSGVANVLTVSPVGVSILGNVTANYFIGNGSQLTDIQAGNIIGGYGNANVYQFLQSGNSVSISTTGNISTTGDVLASNISVSGNIIGNISFDQSISASGNITGNYIIGNGSQLTGINYSNIVGAYSNANVANYLPTYSGNLTAGNTSVSGNAISGNILTAGQISAAGNITGNNFLMYGSGNILGNLNVQGNITFIDSNVIVTNDLYIDLANNQSTYANINGAGFNVGNTGSVPLVNWTYNTAANAWTTNVGVSTTANVVGGNILTAGQISAAGDVTGGNILTAGAGGDISGSGNLIAGNVYTAGNVSAAGNVTGSYFLGNGSQLTGVSNYANANVAAYLSTYTGNLTAGNISVSGNVKAAYFLGNGSQLTGVSNYANATVVAYGEAGWAGNIVPALDATYSLGNATNTWKELWVSGNSVMIGGGNLSVSNGNLLFNGNIIPVQQGANLSVTGNIYGGNVSSAGNIYSNVNISATGNVIAGNILTNGIISASGNVTTDGYFLGTFIGNISGNVTVPGLNTQIIYNNQGHAGASAGLTFNDTSNTVTVANTVLVANTVSVGGNVLSNNVVVSGQIDWLSGGTSAVYQIYNSSTGSLDTIFG